MENFDFGDRIISLLRKITSLPMWLWIVVPTGSVFLLFVIGMTLAFSNFFGIFERGFPSDAEMELTFYQNEPVFEKLLQMTDTDSLPARIFNSSEESGRPTALTNEKWQDYKNIFNQLHLSKGIEKETSNDLYLYVYMGTGQKGYIYSETQLEPIVTNLDDRTILKEHSPVYKRLKGNWYIYLGRI